MTEHSRCMCGEPWRLNAVHREKTPCFDYIEHRWVGLTPEEVLDLFDINNVYGSKWVEFARTVEAALRSKNT